MTETDESDLRARLEKFRQWALEHLKATDMGRPTDTDEALRASMNGLIAAAPTRLVTVGDGKVVITDLLAGEWPTWGRADRP